MEEAAGDVDGQEGGRVGGFSARGRYPSGWTGERRGGWLGREEEMRRGGGEGRGGHGDPPVGDGGIQGGLQGERVSA